MVAPSGEWMCRGAHNNENAWWHEYVGPNVSVISGANLPQKSTVYRLNRFLQNLAWGREARVPSTPIFTIVAFLNVGLRPPKRQNC